MLKSITLAKIEWLNGLGDLVYLYLFVWLRNTHMMKEARGI